ncbi:hypothetical protein SLEP1_g6767 [Rubroshorea leprosula]|uniref:Uncharacterized protein n=1 Tax=Rubroshorea leprosula TaxID=152421 RepID=A0AAV5HW95_9ROSI|nr:hypothetical protein SLEP1_g6767 [Rubroshorea leprosula]
MSDWKEVFDFFLEDPTVVPTSLEPGDQELRTTVFEKPSSWVQRTRAGFNGIRSVEFTKRERKGEENGGIKGGNTATPPQPPPIPSLRTFGLNSSSSVYKEVNMCAYYFINMSYYGCHVPKPKFGGKIDTVHLLKDLTNVQDSELVKIHN